MSRYSNVSTDEKASMREFMRQRRRAAIEYPHQIHSLSLLVHQCLANAAIRKLFRFIMNFQVSLGLLIFFFA